MIKLEHVVLASPEQMKFIIEGMRNPMNSWGKSDSEYVTAGYDIVGFDLGESDHSLMQRLSNTGTDHRKFMRMLPVYVRITAPLYWWKEFDTYKVGTVANSCSTMHKIQAKEFTMDDFSCEHIHIRQSTDVLKETIDALNVFRDVYLNGGILSYENGNQRCYGKNDKEIWWQMIQLLPSSYNQTRNVMMNYEVLANIYKSRKDHKLDEWRNFCKWIEELPYSELITGGINQAMILLLTLPLEVLMDHYWPKSYAKRIPEFTEYVLEYYEKWQNDELDIDKLKEDLWVYGGVRLEEVEGK